MMGTVCIVCGHHFPLILFDAGQAMACCCCLGSTVAFGGGGHESYSINIAATKWRRRKEMMRLMMRMRIVKAVRSDKKTLLHSFSSGSSSSLLTRFRSTESSRTKTNFMRYGEGEERKKGAEDEDIVTFSSKISTEIPFYQPPGVSFDDYINDRPRIFQAMFPDKYRSEQLNDEEWRIQMLPIKIFFASVSPVIVMRLKCKSNGEDYPPSIPLDVIRILELQATRWELKGLEGIPMPSHFDLNVQGTLYSVKRGAQSRLKGDLGISFSLVLPPALALIPFDVLKVLTESVMTSLLEKMKKEVDAGLLSDFSNFGREKMANNNHSTTTIILDGDPKTYQNSHKK